MTSKSTAERETAALIEPCGGALVDLMAGPEERLELRARAIEMPSVRLSRRSECDLELLSTGAFSPLQGFMGRLDYQSVLARMRLADGHLFPIPITLPVESRDGIGEGRDVALRDMRGDLLAVMSVEEVYPWDHAEESRCVFGSEDLRHPLVAEMHRWGPHNLAGRLRVVQLPRHHDFGWLRMTPARVREELVRLGRTHAVAFQTRNPMHRVHEELARRAVEEIEGALLLHPAVGLTKPGDVEHFTRVRTYMALSEQYFDRDRIVLALLPLAMRMAGPREALWHALIRRNFGADHIIIGRDHAGPGLDSRGRPFYGPYAAQDLVLEHEAELGVKMVPFRMLVYLPDEDRYEESTRVAEGTRTESISGTQVREEYLEAGRVLPAWFTRPEVADILRRSHPPRLEQGICVWFTGLSGAGKTRTAEVLTALLQERGRRVSLLDGDVVRTRLSKGLGFTKEDRDMNVLRIGSVAAEIVRHGGVAVCASVSPYRAARNQIRGMVGQDRFIEVFVDTPLEVCEARDPKGLYARARQGDIVGLTGVDDPYEPPISPAVTLDTVDRTIDENAGEVLEAIVTAGFVTATARESAVRSGGS